MLKIHKIATPSPDQWEIVVEGMRNPMNSWDKIDSYKTHIENPDTENTADFEFFVGDNDLSLMQNLAKAGSDHRKYMRMLPVHITLTAPLYWWKEYDTYKVGTVSNSCSTMHKIHAKEFTLDDFSHDHLIDCGVKILSGIIETLNEARDCYLNFDEYYDKGELNEQFNCKKDVWWQMIQLLPSSYNQMRTCHLNYENLMNIYFARRNHKLDEWHTLCDAIENMPYFMDIVREVQK